MSGGLSVMRLILPVFLATACVCALCGPVRGQDGWNPFDVPDTKRSARERLDAGDGYRRERPAQGARRDTEPGAGPAGQGAVQREPVAPLAPVERAELAPVMATDGSGLPFELWRGLDVAKIEELLARVPIPPRSPALQVLWHRLVTSKAGLGGGDQSRFEALRLEALYRSGLLREAAELLAERASAGDDPAIAVLAARSEIGLGQRERACSRLKGLRILGDGLPKILKSEAILISGYCAAAAGDRAAAGLAAELARNEGLDSSPGLAALDAFAYGAKPTAAVTGPVGLLDYRILELAGGVDARAVLGRASPALLAAIALGGGADNELKLAAAEAAARLNAIRPEDLAAAYRALPAVARGDPRAAASGADRDGAGRRAELFRAAETELAPMKKARAIRAFLDEARRAELYLPALQAVAKTCASLTPEPEIGWFAETAIEVSLTSADYERARLWAAFGSSFDRSSSGRLDHWLALADIAGGASAAASAASLAALEERALRGRFSPELLHRIATVLDALDYDVPIRLWEAAGRTPQPNTGYLPETGVLSELQQASKNREFGRTVLLVMATLGPNGAEGAHMLALGDSIRALKRAGLLADARRLGFEALFAAWPRAAHN